MRKIVTIMPLKARSERVTHKNFRELAGRPLYAWATLKAFRLMDLAYTQGHYIYGDDEVWSAIDPKIKERSHWIHEEEAAQFQDSNDFFYDMVKKAVGFDDSITHAMVVNATSPFVHNSCYVGACDALTLGHDSALSAVEVRGRVWNDWNQSMNHDPRTCPRTQKQDPVWIESDAFWLFHKDLMLKEHRRVGHQPMFIPVSFVEQLDINYGADFKMAERLVKSGVSLEARLHP